MAEIALTKGLVAIVDDADFEWLSQWQWSANIVCGKAYARRHIWQDARCVTFAMHRVLTEAPQDLVVDHVNGDSLDNRRANLRVCTARDNSINRARAPSMWGFKGVRKARARWVARIKLFGRLRHLGMFATAEEAARAYDVAAREHFGPFAVLNFPEAV